jgi:hypothetical protein
LAARSAALVMSKPAGAEGAEALRLPASSISLVVLAGVFWLNGRRMSRMPSCADPFAYICPCTTKPLVGDTRRPSASSWKLPERV